MNTDQIRKIRLQTKLRQEKMEEIRKRKEEEQKQGENNEQSRTPRKRSAKAKQVVPTPSN